MIGKPCDQPSESKLSEMVRSRVRLRAMALVIVLAMLVMLLALTMALFSRVTQQRQVSAASSAQTQATFLAQSAVTIIEDDLQQEIEAGSLPDTLPLPPEGTYVFRPRLTATNAIAGVPFRAAPSLQPQASGVSGNATGNIVKISRNNTPFFVASAGYVGSNGSTRASSVATTSPALDGRQITDARWKKPQFLTANESVAYEVPDWIYVDRQGRNPTSFTSNELRSYANAAPSNDQYILGRFAYTIYDESGLLDINVISNALSGNAVADPARRGRLGQVTPGNLGNMTAADFLQVVQWRDSGEPSNPGTVGGLLDPLRTFLQPPTGSKTLLSRQDLLRFASRPGSPIPPTALPFLSTFSREINAPSFEADIPPTTPSSLEADQFNAPLFNARFAAATTLHRPEGDVQVSAGTPVLARRFPLSKLDLLAQNNPDANALQYYFGLKKNGIAYEYVADIGGRIAKLDEVAALGREPNFFEVLQAVILTGSLGRNAGDSYTFDNDRDEKRNLQVMQIGANIIDQWDADDIPTTLRYPSGNPGAWEESYGIENLPYLHNMDLVVWRPVHNRDRFQVWAWFDVWNPHQNATTPPQGITGFRINPKSGKLSGLILYYIWRADINQYYTYSGGQTIGGYQGAQQDILTVNADSLGQPPPGGNSWRGFSASGNYSEPTILGNYQAPSGATDYPTMLFLDYANVPPAISDPLTTNGTRIGPSGSTVQPYLDELVGYYYPKPVPPAPGDAHWEAITNGNGTIVDYRANFGVKAHNSIRFQPVAGQEIILELQANIGGTWHTYQVFDGFLPIAGTGVSGGSAPFSSGSTILMFKREDAPGDFLSDTHHSKAASPADPILASRFYLWNAAQSKLPLWKTDPRTIRFGHSDSAVSSLGKTIRTNPQPYNPLASGPFLEDFTQQIDKGWHFVYGDGTRMPQPLSAFERKPRWGQSSPADIYFWPFGLVANIPDGNVDGGGVNPSYNPARYSDRDGVIRPGDGYVGSGANQGAVPTVPQANVSGGRGGLADRPLMLNRPFRSVGEMGYAFRDLPWKTLDFFSKQSGDLGLLDVFTLDDTPGMPPLVAGKVNLNTRRPEVLAALLEGAGTAPAGALNAGSLSSGESNEIAQALVAESAKAPFRDRGDMVRRVLAPQNSTNATLTGGGTWKPVRKVAREAPVRALAELGSTRTWNLMVDVIVQTGRFTPSSQGGADFQVRGEQRLWVHLAIDRITGEVVDRQTEIVDE